MSQNGTERKGFFLYLNQVSALKKLPPEQAMKVLCACADFCAGNEPDLSDPTVAFAFESWRPLMEAHQKFQRKQQENGAKGGRPKTQKNPKKPNVTQANPEKAEQEQEQENINTSTPPCIPPQGGEPAQDENLSAPVATPPSRSRRKRADEVAAAKIPYGEFGNVKLTPEEFARLNAEHGEKDTADAIALLDLHIGAAKQGDTYRSHYLAMKKWVFNAVEERRAKHARASPGQPAAPTEWQLQKQRQRLMAADLNRLRAEEEREWANWTGWDKPKKESDDGIAIFSGAAIGENEHVVSGGH